MIPSQKNERKKETRHQAAFTARREKKKSVLCVRELSAWTPACLHHQKTRLHVYTRPQCFCALSIEGELGKDSQVTSKTSSRAHELLA